MAVDEQARHELYNELVSALGSDHARPLNQVLAVPATRTIRDIPTEVPLGVEDGMPQDCVLTLDNIGPVRPALCTARITRLSPDRMLEVCEALRVATTC